MSEFLTREEENSIFEKYSNRLESILTLLANCPSLNESLLSLYAEEENHSRLVNAILGNFIKNGHTCTCGRECSTLLKLEAMVLNRLKSKIIKSNEGLVHAYVKILLSKRKICHFDHDDLIQYGRMGLCYALDKYDFRRGLRFNTYAMWWVKGIIENVLRDRDQMVRRPRSNMGDDIYCVDLDDYGLELALKECPTVSEKCFSTYLEEYQILDIIFNALSKLDKRSMLIIQMRFGLFPFDSSGSTLDEIAFRVGVSRERVRQIQKETIDKLVNHLKMFKAI